MKRWLATVLVFGLCSAVVRADVTVVQTTTIEGGMAAMAGGGAPSPKITMRVKGMKSRTDMEMPSVNMSSITDLVAKQMIVLRHDQKTAQVVETGAPASPAAAAAPSGERHREARRGRDPHRQVAGHRRPQVRRVHRSAPR